MDKISVFSTIYLLRSRHKRDRHHLYHRWQINQKVTDHDGQRVAFAIVIPTEQERKRQRICFGSGSRHIRDTDCIGNQRDRCFIFQGVSILPFTRHTSRPCEAC